jgi:hypothetical protein
LIENFKKQALRESPASMKLGAALAQVHLSLLL